MNEINLNNKNSFKTDICMPLSKVKLNHVLVTGRKIPFDIPWLIEEEPVGFQGWIADIQAWLSENFILEIDLLRGEPISAKLYSTNVKITPADKEVAYTHNLTDGATSII